jgi:aminoglycoside 6'-N-acetyltransferase I
LRTRVTCTPSERDSDGVSALPPNHRWSERPPKARAPLSSRSLGIMIERCTSVEQEGWLRMRQELWPHCSREEHLVEMSLFCAQPERFVQFITYADSNQAIGFIEVTVRTDYVNGTDFSPVAFLEGIYVVPEARRRGIARALVAVAERWAINRGCREFASDAAIDNQLSQSLHRALGFEETERVVFYRKRLDGP